VNDTALPAGKIALAVLVSVVLIIGGWYAYWGLTKASTANRYDVNTHGQQYQSGLISQERDRVSGYLAATDPAQKRAIADQFCAVYASLDPAPADLAAQHATICN
jgi:hypothetical protein